MKSYHNRSILSRCDSPTANLLWQASKALQGSTVDAQSACATSTLDLQNPLLSYINYEEQGIMALSSLKGLPTSLLLLLAAQLATAAQPQHPTAIRKMGFDAGEKFFPEYYAFSDEDAAPSQQHVIANSTAKPAIPARRGGILTEEEEALLAVNASASLPYRAPLAAHYYYSDSSSKRSVEARGDDVGADVDDGDGDGDGWVNSFLSHRARYLVQVKLAGAKRDYACPTGTSSCASIGYPDSCCQSGTTCVQIDDTGLGSVGCCPDGESCAGEIACSDGQQGCSSESGGGCCIPGYECASVGCK